MARQPHRRSEDALGSQRSPRWFKRAVRFDVWARGPHPAWRRAEGLARWLRALDHSSDTCPKTSRCCYGQARGLACDVARHRREPIVRTYGIGMAKAEVSEAHAVSCAASARGSPGRWLTGRGHRPRVPRAYARSARRSADRCSGSRAVRHTPAGSPRRGCAAAWPRQPPRHPGTPCGIPR
jgi:hypothetical protein